MRTWLPITGKYQLKSAKIHALRYHPKLLKTGNSMSLVVVCLLINLWFICRTNYQATLKKNENCTLLFGIISNDYFN